MMPSLLKYFTIVGGVLLALLIGLNAVLQPGGPGPRLVNASPKAAPVQLDPQATKVERLRAEEAALAAAKAETPQPVTVTVPQPVIQVAAQPAVTPAPEVSAPAALTNAPSQEEAAQAVRLAKEKMQAEKARKRQLARARAKAKALEEASASRQQDQIYYGYAPRPSYGPFGQGGGWQGGQRW